MTKTFNKIFVYPHSGKIRNPNDRIHEVIDAIRVFGMSTNIPVFVDKQDETIQGDKNTLFISVGGDGTMLKAAKHAVQSKSSTLGINLGNLGFLTDFDAYNEPLHGPNSLEILLEDILNNEEDAYLDKRLILQANGEHLAVNEFIVAFKESMRGMIEYEIFTNGRFVARQSGSGVIVATPTGSTAFSLSVGGPIISPRSNSILIIPIAAHTLTSRPIVVSGVRDTVEIRATNKPGRAIKLYADDNVVDESSGGRFVVKIKPHTTKARFWHRKDWNFFDVLSEKMKWE